MTHPYGRPYTLTTALGDMPVHTVALQDTTVPPDYVAVAGATGPVMLVPTVCLTPVDTTPAEPEPGAWLIGTVPCIRLTRPIERPWFRETSQGRTFGTWAETWGDIGGAGATIRRLIPEPAPVALPFEVTDISDCTAQVRLGASSGMRVVIDHTTDAAGDYTAHAYEPDVAEAKGWALLTAARAAREATS
jgi:hypothetical protein